MSTGYDLARPDLRVRRPFLGVLLGALALGCLIAPAVGCQALMATQKAKFETEAFTQCVQAYVVHCVSSGADLEQCVVPGAALVTCAGG